MVGKAARERVQVAIIQVLIKKIPNLKTKKIVWSLKHVPCMNWSQFNQYNIFSLWKVPSWMSARTVRDTWLFPIWQDWNDILSIGPYIELSAEWPRVSWVLGKHTLTPIFPILNAFVSIWIFHKSLCEFKLHYD